MKNLLILILAGITIFSLHAQEDHDTTSCEEKVISTKKSGTSITVSEDEIISVNENNDTTRIKIGRKGISIIETPEGTKIDIHNIEEEDIGPGDNSSQQKTITKHKKFKGHWAGIQFGLNNYVNNEFSTSLDNSMDFMDLNTGKSWTLSLNFMQHNFGLKHNVAGIVTGLGLEWSNYNFDRDSNIRKDSTGYIVSYPLTSLGNIVKNKVQTTYLTVPLLFEFQIPAGKNKAYFCVGPVGSVKIGSHSKIIYRDNGDRKKIKNKDDFNLSPLKWGITARAGYKGLNIFATYYFTTLFEHQRGPELYPFSAGLTLIHF